MSAPSITSDPTSPGTHHEANLIALAKMYGEACGELHKARHKADLRWRFMLIVHELVAGPTLDEQDIVARLTELVAAEAEALTLRERVEKLEEALKPFGTDPEMSGVYAFKLGQGITISAPQWFEAARAVLSSSDEK